MRKPRADAIGTLRRNPAFARLYTAQLVSFAGDWFAVVALLGLVLDLTGSAALSALVFTLDTVPFALVSPLAGVVADRFDRRIVMISVDILRAGAALGFLAARTDATLWIAFVCIALIGMGAAFFEPASSAALPNLVREEDLPTATLLMGSTWGTMLAVGAALGGVVTAVFGRDAAFIGDAVSFLASGVLITTVQARFHAEAIERGRRIEVIADIKELIRFARSDSRVASLIFVKGGFGVSAGAIAMIAVLAKEVFHRGDTGIGILMSARGLGALIGPFLFRRIFGTSDRALFRALSVAFAVYGLGYVAVGASPGLWAAAAGAFIAHLGGGAQWTMSTLGLQRFTPDRIRGRVFSADYMLVTFTLGSSIAAAGVLADHIDPRAVTIAFAAVAGAWSLTWTLLTRSRWPVRERARGGTLRA